MLAGCVAPGGGPADLHEPGALAEVVGARARLRADLDPERARAALALVEGLEDGLDTAFPFLSGAVGAVGSAAPLTVVVGDPARLALHAREHGITGAAGAFACGRGEVFALAPPDLLPIAGVDEAGPTPLEPPSRPLAAALLRRRLLARLGGELQETWLEDGLALVWADAAAPPAHAAQVRRRSRERLLDAHLPLFLGGPRALEAVACARGPAAKRQVGSPALAWAVVRFLLAEGGRDGARLLVLALEDAAGLAPQGALEAARGELRGLEPAFERWLHRAVREELLEALLRAPHAADRWEAAAALRLLANVALDPDAQGPERARQVQGAATLLDEDPGPLRLLDLFQTELAQVAQARARGPAAAALEQRVRQELDRRAAGWGHPALEAARQSLRRAILRAAEGT